MKTWLTRTPRIPLVGVRGDLRAAAADRWIVPRKLAQAAEISVNNVIWLLDQNRAKSQKCHGDPGWTVGGTGPGGGWLSGTTRVDPVPKLSTPGGPPATWGADCWNITTVRYPPDFKRVVGANPLPGCSENHGINNPLQSPHPGGLLVGFVDGSEQFISEAAELAVLLRIAIRSDGQDQGVVLD